MLLLLLPPLPRREGNNSTASRVAGVTGARFDFFPVRRGNNERRQPAPDCVM